MLRLAKFPNSGFRAELTGPTGSELYLPNLPDLTEAAALAEAVARRLHLPFSFLEGLPAERKAHVEALAQRFIAEKKLTP